MDDNTLEGQWEVEGIAGPDRALQPPVDGTSPYVIFSDSSVTANVGCNTFSGGVSIGDDGSFASDQLATTLMACPPPVDTQEANMRVALAEADGWAVNGETATLSVNQVVVVELRRLDTSIESSHWFVTAINNGRCGVQSIISGTEPTLWFGENGALTGTTGCNDLMATYRVDGDSLVLGELGSTRKFCAEPDGLMRQETEMLVALAGVSEYVITGPTLRLLDGDGATQITARRIPNPVPSTPTPSP